MRLPAAVVQRGEVVHLPQIFVFLQDHVCCRVKTTNTIEKKKGPLHQSSEVSFLPNIALSFTKYLSLFSLLMSKSLHFL